ncbi:unnamed protein product [Bursaphelenchus xylophilus]|uniref:(pine wood nematode) hypothetical protein n=1 Tax=Bursaphelenchus xylophilus TaxID=6326 RepID=A0A1I7RIT4_BURXY|nr:unnamed protein product [Bursaphelenchus xylophilus]CAG9119078.1 unnamed protein product [Bursaphelenchus xylophilus]
MEHKKREYKRREERHFCVHQEDPAVIVKRCAHCDEAMKDEPAYCVDGNTYHAKHFLCCACRQPIEPDQTFQVLDRQRICCSPCFAGHYAPKCVSCGRGIVDVCIRVNGRELFHDKCFVCSRCKHPLNVSEILPDGDGGYIDQDCYWANRLLKFVALNKQKMSGQHASS